MNCPPCHAPMRLIDYMDTRDELPLVWMKGWRCDRCGFAINPLGEFNRRFLEFDVRYPQGVRSGHRASTHLEKTEICIPF